MCHDHEKYKTKNKIVLYSFWLNRKILLIHYREYYEKLSQQIFYFYIEYNYSLIKILVNRPKIYDTNSSIFIVKFITYKCRPPISPMKSPNNKKKIVYTVIFN